MNSTVIFAFESDVDNYETRLDVRGEINQETIQAILSKFSKFLKITFNVDFHVVDSPRPREEDDFTLDDEKMQESVQLYQALSNMRAKLSNSPKLRNDLFAFMSSEEGKMIHFPEEVDTEEQKRLQFILHIYNDTKFAEYILENWWEPKGDEDVRSADN
jgi:hypothetical protein